MVKEDIFNDGHLMMVMEDIFNDGKGGHINDGHLMMVMEDIFSDGKGGFHLGLSEYVKGHVYNI